MRKNSLTGVESNIDRRITSENLSVNKSMLLKIYFFFKFIFIALDSSHNTAEVDERDLLKRAKNETFLEFIGMLCPLLVEVGISTVCFFRFANNN